MDHFTLNHDDIQACIELACDGINLHLNDQNKVDVIHKIMYAVATAAQNNQAIMTKLDTKQIYQYTINIQHQL